MSLDFILRCGLCPLKHIDCVEAVNRSQPLRGLIKSYITYCDDMMQYLLSLNSMYERPVSGVQIYYSLGAQPGIWTHSASGLRNMTRPMSNTAILLVMSANGQLLPNRAPGQVSERPRLPPCPDESFCSFFSSVNRC